MLLQTFLENNLPPYLIAPRVDHVNVETDEDVDDNFDFFSDKDMEAEDIVSSTDIRKYADAVVNKWFEYKVNFGDVIKQKNPTLEGNFLLRKIKVNSYGTFTIVDSYKLDVLYNHVDILLWWKENERLFPLIALMARVFLSREPKSCFQEIFFIFWLCWEQIAYMYACS